MNSTLPFGVLASSATAATAPLQIVAGTSTPVSGTITIANTGNAVLNISSLQLVLTGTSTVLPFTQSNNCGPTVAAGASCVVTVTFAPPEGGGGATAYTAGVVIADNALGTPHTANISAYDTADDFTLTESTTSITVPSSGGSGSVILTSTPDPGPYPYSVSYTLFGMPPGATYSFLPASVNPSTAAAPTALNIVLPTYQNVVLSNLTGPQKLGIVSDRRRPA